MYNKDMLSALIISSIGETIVQNLSRWNAILGIVLVVLALVAVFASTPIVMRTKLSDEKKAKVILAAKIAGMLLAVLGALFVLL